MTEQERQDYVEALRAQFFKNLLSYLQVSCSDPEEAIELADTVRKVFVCSIMDVNCELIKKNEDEIRKKEEFHKNISGKLEISGQYIQTSRPQAPQGRIYRGSGGSAL